MSPSEYAQYIRIKAEREAKERMQLRELKCPEMEQRIREIWKKAERMKMRIVR